MCVCVVSLCICLGSFLCMRGEEEREKEGKGSSVFSKESEMASYKFSKSPIIIRFFCTW